MKICDILEKPLILAQLQATQKEGVLREMALHVCTHVPELASKTDAIFQALIQREALGSTGVGEGVAIPHAKIPELRHLLACFGRASQGILFEAVDYQPVRLLFVLLVPENSAGAHLKALARISRLLKNPAFRSRLLELPEKEDLYQAFCEEDAKY